MKKRRKGRKREINIFIFSLKQTKYCQSIKQKNYEKISEWIEYYCYNNIYLSFFFTYLCMILNKRIIWNLVIIFTIYCEYISYLYFLRNK